MPLGAWIYVCVLSVFLLPGVFRGVATGQFPVHELLPNIYKHKPDSQTWKTSALGFLCSRAIHGHVILFFLILKSINIFLFRWHLSLPLSLSLTHTHTHTHTYPYPKSIRAEEMAYLYMHITPYASKCMPRLQRNENVKMLILSTMLIFAQVSLCSKSRTYKVLRQIEITFLMRFISFYNSGHSNIKTNDK
jgi:hypothetical protein